MTTLSRRVITGLEWDMIEGDLGRLPGMLEVELRLMRARSAAAASAQGRLQDLNRYLVLLAAAGTKGLGDAAFRLIKQVPRSRWRDLIQSLEEILGDQSYSLDPHAQVLDVVPEVLDLILHIHLTPPAARPATFQPESRAASTGMRP